MNQFVVRDSGERQSFESGMVRDTVTRKTEFHRVADGPMLERWAEHLTKGKEKYQDYAPGRPNWTLANGIEEYERFRQSAFRHFIQWFCGDLDEDHAAAVFFNINGAEYVKDRLTPVKEVRTDDYLLNRQHAESSDPRPGDAATGRRA